MASRKRSQQTPGNVGRDLLSIGLIALAALVLASLVGTGPQQGAIPQALSTALTLLLGVGAWVVPGVLFVAGAALTLRGQATVTPRIAAGSAALLVALLALVHLSRGEGGDFAAERVISQGGYIGAAVAVALRSLFGLAGAYIILCSIGIAGGLLVAGVSWSEFLSSIGTAIITVASAIGQAFARLGRAFVDMLPRLPVFEPAQGAAAEAAAPAPPRVPKVSRRRRRSRRGADSDEEPVIFNELDDEEARPGDSHGEAPQREEPGQPPAERKPSGGHMAAAAAAQAKPDETKPTANKSERPKAGAARAQAVEKAADRTSRGGESASAASSVPQIKLPTVDMLTRFPDDEPTREDHARVREQARLLEQTLAHFGIKARVINYLHGPTVTRYEVSLEPGVRVSQVTRLAGDIAMAMATADVRIEAPIPGKRAVGIEVPNRQRRLVSLRSVVESEKFQKHPSVLAFGVGKDVAGNPVVADLATMPHLLVAGQTGSGKSVMLHSMIVSMLLRAQPSQLRFVLIDPKRVEMKRYDGIPHLYAPVVYSVREAADVLRKMIREMERRYDRFAVAEVSSIDEYNELARMEQEAGSDEYEPLPRVVIVIDELADLMVQARAEFEHSICRLAQLARATGIHVVIATQRPSVNVVTGTIKANFPARIALRLPAGYDSRTILDTTGADKLLGSGDMLFISSEMSKPLRLQGAYIPGADVDRIADFLRSQAEPDYQVVPEVADDETADYTAEADVGDELFEAAVRYVVAEGEASVSMLQRRFKIGYARAGRLIDLMERRGIVGPHEGSRPRRVLIGPHNVDQVLAGILGRASGSDGDSGAAEQEPLPIEESGEG